MRDLSSLKTREQYDRDVAFLDGEIEKRRRALAVGIRNESYAGQYAFQGAIHSLERLRCRVSRGDSIADLAASFEVAVDLHEWALGFEEKCYPPEVMESRKRFRKNFEMYVHALALLSLGICLRADDRTLTRLLRVLGNEGEDALFDRLAAWRVPSRPIGSTLAYPKVTQRLAEAFDAAEPEKGQRIRRYLDTWYRKMKGTQWHDSHLRRDGESYYGYWCFEAAAAVVVLDVDDDALRGSPYYPQDLARIETA